MIATLICFLVLWALKIYDVPALDEYSIFKIILISFGVGFILSLICRIILRNEKYILHKVELFYLKSRTNEGYLSAKEDETGTLVRFTGDGCGDQLIYYNETSITEVQIVIIDDHCEPYVEIESKRYKSWILRKLFFNLRFDNTRLFIRKEEMEIISKPKPNFKNSLDGMHMD